MSEREPVWAVQSNLGGSSDVEMLREACERAALPCIGVTAIPFSDELPDVPTRPRTVFYGSTSFIKRIRRSGRWNPGAFFDEDAFRFSVAQARYGSCFLNADARLATLEALAAEPMADDQLLFVRPDRDLKEFAGGVQSAAEFRAWHALLAAGGLTIGVDTPVAWAAPKSIAHEWRLFVVDGRVVASSHYRREGRLSVWPDTPQAVREFGEQMARRWAPALAFVLDVAESGGDLLVIETNCINSAGFYASDVGAIVDAVSRAVCQRVPEAVERRA